VGVCKKLIYSYLIMLSMNQFTDNMQIVDNTMNTQSNIQTNVKNVGNVKDVDNVKDVIHYFFTQPLKYPSFANNGTHYYCSLLYNLSE